MVKWAIDTIRRREVVEWEISIPSKTIVLPSIIAFDDVDDSLYTSCLRHSFSEYFSDSVAYNLAPLLLFPTLLLSMTIEPHQILTRTSRLWWCCLGAISKIVAYVGVQFCFVLAVSTANIYSFMFCLLLLHSDSTQCAKVISTTNTNITSDSGVGP